MAFNKRTVLISIVVIGLAIVLVAGVGLHGRRETMASRSAAAFREALRKGEPVGVSTHGHGALSPGAEVAVTHAEHGGSEMKKSEGADQEGHAMAGHADMPRHDMTASAAGGDEHAMHRTSTERVPPAGHAGMQHGSSVAPPAGTSSAGHAGMQHGTSAMPTAGTAPVEMSGSTPAPALPQAKAAEASPGQPATTLQPDSLDQPVETSVVDATRSLEMAREMGGMAGMKHGATSYRQLDAGRESAAAVPQGESVPPESSVTPKTGAPAPHHHGMQHGSPQPSPTPVPRPKPPSTERKPSTPESAPTHPPHHHSGGSGDGAGESGGPR